MKNIWKAGTRRTIRAVNGRQTVMQKDGIEALHQYWDPLVQEVCLSSLTRVQRNPPSRIISIIIIIIIITIIIITSNCSAADVQMSASCNTSDNLCAHGSCSENILDSSSSSFSFNGSVYGLHRNITQH